MLFGIFLLVSAIAFHYVNENFDLSFYTQKLRFEQKYKELRDRAYLRYNYELTNEGRKISPRTIVQDEQNEEYYLTEIINNSTLIFRFKELNCMMCVDSLVQVISQFADSTGNANIIILSDYRYIRDLYTFKRLHRLKTPIYSCKKKGLGIPMETKNLPYLFVLAPDLSVSYFFVPDKYDYRYVKKYLKNVGNILSQ